MRTRQPSGRAASRHIFVQCYGLTEATGSIAALPPEVHTPEGTPQMRAAGKALPGVEVRVVDESGADCVPDAVGEVVVRGRSVMNGYWKNDAAAAETIDADGWLRTGDAGFLDEEGFVYVHDRVKDMIISGGENIYPTEGEDATGARSSPGRGPSGRSPIPRDCRARPAPCRDRQAACLARAGPPSTTRARSSRASP